MTSAQDCQGAGRGRGRGKGRGRRAGAGAGAGANRLTLAWAVGTSVLAAMAWGQSVPEGGGSVAGGVPYEAIGRMCSLASGQKPCPGGTQCVPCFQRRNVAQVGDPRYECLAFSDGECAPCFQGDFCPRGTRNPFLLSSANLCPAGSFCPNVSHVEPCAPGHFCPGGVFSYAFTFPSGEGGAGEAVSFACPEGKGLLCEEGESAPIGQCPAGFFCPTPDAKLLCPKGSFCKPYSLEPTPCRFGAGCSSAGMESSGAWWMGLGIAAGGVLLLWAGQALCMRRIDRGQLREKGVVLRSKHVAELTRVVVSHLLGIPAQALAEAIPGFRPINEPITLRFHDLGLVVGVGPRRKVVLRHLSGRFAESRLTAILGPSGCGKTSLITLAAGRETGGRVVGRITVDGRPDIELHHLAKVMAFVPQDDTLFGELTIRENLYYSASLRLPRSTTTAQRSKLVAGVLEVLGLEHIQCAVVGSVEQRGISGGQRKRVNIGLELVADPSVLFLDEPTSGLAASGTLRVIRALKSMAYIRRTVVAVIHQPRYEVFTLFHEVVLLGKSGRVVYSGDTQQVLSYFERIGFGLPKHENPADYFLDVIMGFVPRAGDPSFTTALLPGLWLEHQGSVREVQLSTRSEISLPAESVERIVRRWGRVDTKGSGIISGEEIDAIIRRAVPGIILNREEVASVLHVLDASEGGGISLGDFMLIATKEYSRLRPDVRCEDDETSLMDKLMTLEAGGDVGYWSQANRGAIDRVTPGGIEQFRTFLGRGTRQWLRTFSYVVAWDTALVIMAAGFVGLLTGTAWLPEEWSKITLLSTATHGVLQSVSGLRVLGMGERLLQRREARTGTSTSAYYLGKSTAGLVDCAIHATLYTLVYYSLVVPEQGLLRYWAVSMCVGWSCQSLGVLLSLCLRPAAAILAAVIIPLVAGVYLGGVDPRLEDMHVVMRWVTHASFTLWATEATAVAELEVMAPHARARAAAVAESLELVVYTKGRFALDIAALMVIGAVTRLVAYAVFVVGVSRSNLTPGERVKKLGAALLRGMGALMGLTPRKPRFDPTEDPSGPGRSMDEVSRTTSPGPSPLYPSHSMARRLWSRKGSVALGDRSEDEDSLELLDAPPVTPGGSFVQRTARTVQSVKRLLLVGLATPMSQRKRGLGGWRDAATPRDMEAGEESEEKSPVASPAANPPNSNAMPVVHATMPPSGSGYTVGRRPSVYVEGGDDARVESRQLFEDHLRDSDNDDDDRDIAGRSLSTRGGSDHAMSSAKIGRMLTLVDSDEDDELNARARTFGRRHQSLLELGMPQYRRMSRANTHEFHRKRCSDSTTGEAADLEAGNTPPSGDARARIVRGAQGLRRGIQDLLGTPSRWDTRHTASSRSMASRVMLGTSRSSQSRDLTGISTISSYRMDILPPGMGSTEETPIREGARQTVSSRSLASRVMVGLALPTEELGARRQRDPRQSSSRSMGSRVTLGLASTASGLTGTGSGSQVDEGGHSMRSILKGGGRDYASPGYSVQNAPRLLRPFSTADDAGLSLAEGTPITSLGGSGSKTYSDYTGSRSQISGTSFRSEKSASGGGASPPATPRRPFGNLDANGGGLRPSAMAGTSRRPPLDDGRPRAGTPTEGGSPTLSTSPGIQEVLLGGLGAQLVRPQDRRVSSGEFSREWGPGSRRDSDSGWARPGSPLNLVRKMIGGGRRGHGKHTNPMYDPYNGGSYRPGLVPGWGGLGRRISGGSNATPSGSGSQIPSPTRRVVRLSDPPPLREAVSSGRAPGGCDPPLTRSSGANTEVEKRNSLSSWLQAAGPESQAHKESIAMHMARMERTFLAGASVRRGVSAPGWGRQSSKSNSGQTSTADPGSSKRMEQFMNPLAEASPDSNDFTPEVAAARGGWGGAVAPMTALTGASSLEPTPPAGRGAVLIPPGRDSLVFDTPTGKGGSPKPLFGAAPMVSSGEDAPSAFPVVAGGVSGSLHGTALSSAPEMSTEDELETVEKAITRMARKERRKGGAGSRADQAPLNALDSTRHGIPLPAGTSSEIIDSIRGMMATTSASPSDQDRILQFIQSLQVEGSSTLGAARAQEPGFADEEGPAIRRTSGERFRSPLRRSRKSSTGSATSGASAGLSGSGGNGVRRSRSRSTGRARPRASSLGTASLGEASEVLSNIVPSTESLQAGSGAADKAALVQSWIDSSTGGGRDVLLRQPSSEPAPASSRESPPEAPGGALPDGGGARAVSHLPGRLDGGAAAANPARRANAASGSSSAEGVAGAKQPARRASTASGSSSRERGGHLASGYLRSTQALAAAGGWLSSGESEITRAWGRGDPPLGGGRNNPAEYHSDMSFPGSSSGDTGDNSSLHMSVHYASDREAYTRSRGAGGPWAAAGPRAREGRGPVEGGAGRGRPPLSRSTSSSERGPGGGGPANRGDPPGVHPRSSSSSERGPGGGGGGAAACGEPPREVRPRRGPALSRSSSGSGREARQAPSAATPGPSQEPDGVAGPEPGPLQQAARQRGADGGLARHHADVSMSRTHHGLPSGPVAIAGRGMERTRGGSGSERDESSRDGSLRRATPITSPSDPGGSLRMWRHGSNASDAAISLRDGVAAGSALGRHDSNVSTALSLRDGIAVGPAAQGAQGHSSRLRSRDPNTRDSGVERGGGGGVRRQDSNSSRGSGAERGGQLLRQGSSSSLRSRDPSPREGRAERGGELLRQGSSSSLRSRDPSPRDSGARSEVRRQGSSSSLRSRDPSPREGRAERGGQLLRQGSSSSLRSRDPSPRDSGADGEGGGRQASFRFKSHPLAPPATVALNGAAVALAAGPSERPSARLPESDRQAAGKAPHVSSPGKRKVVKRGKAVLATLDDIAARLSGALPGSPPKMCAPEGGDANPRRSEAAAAGATGGGGGGGGGGEDVGTARISRIERAALEALGEGNPPLQVQRWAEEAAVHALGHQPARGGNPPRLATPGDRTFPLEDWDTQSVQ